jgi:hypothetical protein
VPIGSRIFSCPNRPDRLWGSLNFLSNGYLGLFPRGQSGRGVKLNTHLQVVPRTRKCGSIHTPPMRLHGVVLNSLSTGTTLLIYTAPCNMFLCFKRYRRQRISVRNSYLRQDVWDRTENRHCCQLFAFGRAVSMSRYVDSVKKREFPVTARQWSPTSQ